METLLCNVGMFLLGVLACGIICYRADAEGAVRKDSEVEGRKDSEVEGRKDSEVEGRKDSEVEGRKTRVRFYVVRNSIGVLELWAGKPERDGIGWKMTGTIPVMKAGKVCTGISFRRFGLDMWDYTTQTYNSEPVEVFPIMDDD